MIGWGKTFRITWLQMERIISSKGPKYSLAWCGALLREQRVSHHLPHRKSKRIQHCNNRHKNIYERRFEGTFKGVRWRGDEIELFIFLHLFYLHLDFVCVTHCTATSCGFTVHGLLSSTLVKRLNLYSPRKPTQKCWHADGLRSPGIHILICSRTLCEHKCNSTVGVWTFMTHLKDSCYLKSCSCYLSCYIIKEKTAKPCITGWIPMVQQKSLIHWTCNQFSRNTSAFWHSQQTHSVFAGNGSFNCFPWHGPCLLWIIYCTQRKRKCKRLVLFWEGVRCSWLISRERNQFWHCRCCTWSAWPRVKCWTQEFMPKSKVKLEWRCGNMAWKLEFLAKPFPEMLHCCWKCLKGQGWVGWEERTLKSESSFDLLKKICCRTKEERRSPMGGIKAVFYEL